MSDTIKNIGRETGGYANKFAKQPLKYGFAGGTFLKDEITKNNSVDVPDSTGRPGWTLSDPSGHLRPDLMLNGSMPAAAGQSQKVLDTLIARANTQGPTQSAQYLMDSNNRNMTNSLGDADATMRSGLANQVSGMAMRGGVDAGSRERLARSFGNTNLMDKQRIMNDANGANLNILAQDEQNKTNMMSALPAQLLNQAGFEQNGKQFDITNTLNSVGGKYNADMSGWAANQAAREQAQLANKKSGLLGLGIAGIL